MWYGNLYGLLGFILVQLSPSSFHCGKATAVPLPSPVLLLQCMHACEHAWWVYLEHLH